MNSVDKLQIYYIMYESERKTSTALKHGTIGTLLQLCKDIHHILDKLYNYCETLNSTEYNTLEPAISRIFNCYKYLIKACDSKM